VTRPDIAGEGAGGSYSRKGCRNRSFWYGRPVMARARLTRPSGLGPGLALAAKAVFYAVLIVACVLFAPEEPQIFIYTEF